ncbi:MAG: cytochrome c, partial [Pantoea agglomerans]
HIVLVGGQLPGVNGAPSTITMPAFGWRLDDQQVADVVNFVRNSWGNKASEPVSAKQVAELRKDEKDRLGSADIRVLEGK